MENGNSNLWQREICTNKIKIMKAIIRFIFKLFSKKSKEKSIINNGFIQDDKLSWIDFCPMADEHYDCGDR